MPDPSNIGQTVHHHSRPVRSRIRALTPLPAPPRRGGTAARNEPRNGLVRWRATRTPLPASIRWVLPSPPWSGLSNVGHESSPRPLRPLERATDRAPRYAGRSMPPTRLRPQGAGLIFGSSFEVVTRRTAVEPEELIKFSEQRECLPPFRSDPTRPVRCPPRQRGRELPQRLASQRCTRRRGGVRLCSQPRSHVALQPAEECTVGLHIPDRVTCRPPGVPLPHVRACRRTQWICRAGPPLTVPSPVHGQGREAAERLPEPRTDHDVTDLSAYQTLDELPRDPRGAKRCQFLRRALPQRASQT